MTYRPYAAIIQEAQAGMQSSAVKMLINNITGSAMPALSVVSANISSGDMELTAVDDEDIILSTLGITIDSIPDGDEGYIVKTGLIDDITTALTYGAVYLNSDGSLTNTKPSIGVSGFVEGDFILRVGVIAKNKDNPSDKDLIVDFAIIGQL